MRISDLINMGLLNLWRRKLRTLLTIFGVIIGSVSVVLMMSIAFGADKAINDQIESFGSIRVVQVRGERLDYYKFYEDDNAENQDSGSKQNTSNSDEEKLNDEAIKKIENVEHVDFVLPYYDANIQINAGKLQCYTEVMACDLAKLNTMGFTLGKGRLPEEGEKAIIGYPFLSNSFYDPNSNDISRDPDEVPTFQETMNVFFNEETGKNGTKKSPMRMEFVGESKENTEYSYQLLMDMKTFKDMRIRDIRRYGNYNEFKKDRKKDLYSGLKVQVDKTENVVAVTDAIKEMGYEANNQIEILDQMKEQTNIMKYVLGGIGFVSLFVAAIGITNTMVMAIYERTREIGVMKVLGAEVLDILKLFLLEAALIGLIGGSIGLAFSYLGSHFINVAVQNAGEMEPGMQLSYIPAWLAVVSLIFSTLIGVIAGIIPAIKATKLSALEAIKTQG